MKKNNWKKIENLKILNTEEKNFRDLNMKIWIYHSR